jgi:hypothetical protein
MIGRDRCQLKQPVSLIPRHFDRCFVGSTGRLQPSEVVCGTDGGVSWNLPHHLSGAPFLTCRRSD